jgi:nucleotide-binding universal stress UspA family protein
MKPRVVAAIDRSAAARPVLEWAASFARSLGCSVQALHVSEDGDDATAALAAAAEIPLRTVTGDVIACLTRAAEDPGVAAIVLGGRGLPGGPRPAGHVALQLITQVTKPVILVPPDVAEPIQLRRALLPLEGTPGGGRVPESVLELLADAGVQIAAVHVDDDASLPAYSDQVQHETEAFAHEFIARNVPTNLDVALTLRVGQPGRELLAASEAATSDLIVVAWSRDLSPGRAEIVRELLERSQIPVLLVPIGTDRPAHPAKGSAKSKRPEEDTFGTIGLRRGRRK